MSEAARAHQPEAYQADPAHKVIDHDPSELPFLGEVDASQLSPDVVEQTAPSAQAAETVLPTESEPVSGDRWMARAALRTATLAERFSRKAEGAAYAINDKRTVRETGSDALARGREAVNDKVENGRAVGRKIGSFVDREIIQTAQDVKTGFSESFQSAREIGAEAKTAVKGYFAEKAAAAAERKQTRAVNKAHGQALRDNKRFDKTAKRVMKEDHTEALKMNKAFDKETRAQEKAMNKAERQAHRINDRMDNRAERAQKIEDTKEALKLKANRAKTVGKAALKTSGLVAVGVGVITAEAGARAVKRGAEATISGARKSAEYAGEKIDGAVKYGNEAVDAYAESLQYKNERKAKQADLKKSRDLEKAHRTLSGSKTRIQARSGRAAARAQARFDRKTA